VGVPQLGACEAACDGVANPRQAQQPRREQISQPARDPRMQGDAARRQAGLSQDALPDGMAFALIGVEHIVGGTANDRVELPRKIGGILYPGVHALSAHRRMDMSGVACEKHAAVTVLGDLALVTVKAR
jgi:hypothetical protein